MRTLKKFYVTFRARTRWTRYGDRYYEFQATSEDQAMKTTIDLFGRDWENLYTEEEWNDGGVLKRLPKEEYKILPYSEHAREVERQNRIPYKTYREKEDNGKKSSTQLDK